MFYLLTYLLVRYGMRGRPQKIFEGDGTKSVHLLFSGAAWVVGARGGLQFCLPQKS